MLKSLLLLAFLCITLLANAQDPTLGVYKGESKPKPSRKVVESRQLGHDSRFRVFTFAPNTVFKFTAVYDYPTYIEFESDETVSSITNPKRGAWQLVPSGNKLFIKPLLNNADTPITLMTNKRVYFFEFFATEPSESYDTDFAFYTKFYYPNYEESQSIRQYAKSLIPNLDKPENYNFNYTIAGEQKIYPLKVFDNGQFTYFEFRDKGGRIPAIFAVDTNNYESLINYKMIANYVVVERINDRFSLRSGQDIVCVFNENLYKKP